MGILKKKNKKKKGNLLKGLGEFNLLSGLGNKKKFESDAESDVEDSKNWAQSQNESLVISISSKVKMDQQDNLSGSDKDENSSAQSVDRESLLVESDYSIRKSDISNSDSLFGN